MDRRRFLRASASTVGAVALGPLLAACSGDDRDRDAERTLAAPRMLDGHASDAPIDTVVIVMLENRSFDHYVGWLGSDARYLDAGRSRYGRSFAVNASATAPPMARKLRRTTSSTRPTNRTLTATVAGRHRTTLALILRSRGRATHRAAPVPCADRARTE